MRLIRQSIYAIEILIQVVDGPDQLELGLKSSCPCRNDPTTLQPSSAVVHGAKNTHFKSDPSKTLLNGSDTSK